ncbi:hypothetical protein [Clostridium merdae]|uniref:hypothetical protein n=1 Tax=Clostridium merdae TaxID=1958780 RepID=UPI000A26716B|nr:hypothetical protein [Clostridium merdae]
MNKTKSKVLSLVLASAMIVSSFSSLNFASAATSTRENGRLTVDTDELYLVSNSNQDGLINIDEFLGDPTVKTYDNEEASDVEFVSFTHASGDRIVKSIKDNTKGDNDVENALYLSKDAKGKEVITVTYEGEYDRDDKTVKVRAKKDITIYANPVGAQIVAKVTDNEIVDDKPDSVEVASTNDKELTFGVYEASQVSDSSMHAKYTLVTTDKGFTVKTTSDKAFALNKNVRVPFEAGVYTLPTTFKEVGEGNDTVDSAREALADAKAALANYTAGDFTALEEAVTKAKDELKTAQDDENYKDLSKTDLEKAVADAKAADDAASTAETQAALAAAQDKLEKYNTAAATVVTKTAAVKTAEDDLADAKAGDVTKKAALEKAVTDAKTALDSALKGDNVSKVKYASTGTISTQATLNTKTDSDKKDTYKFTVAKQWTVNYSGLEINKKGSSTYISEYGESIDFDSDKWSTEQKSKAISITGYDIKLADNVTALDVNGGKVGKITGNDAARITVDGATTGDIESNIIDIDDGNVGTLKQKGNNPTITIDEGKAKEIDADKAVVTINGGTIAGDVKGKTVDIDADDDEIATTINGNVTAKDKDEPKVEISSSSDALVKITGTVKGEIFLNDENVSINVVDADYENDLTFDDFTGSISSIINTSDVNIDVLGASKVVVKGTLDAGSIDIEDEDGMLTIAGGRINSVSGDGTLAVPAGKLFIEDSMEDITLKLTDGLSAGATAFQAYSSAVSVDDFKTLGYTVEQKAANSDVDKFVISAVTFAGVQLNKADLSIAKGYSDTLSVANYPTGTALPAGASIHWDIDANDDYFTMTTDGNTATIKALDFNKDYATDNKATVTATVVDENGNSIDGYVSASATVIATAVPASTVTVDTKTVNMGTGSVYQYIAKSSTGAVMTAASSDTQIATVELFNAADARGYKFQIKALAVGTATITTTDANGATATTIVNVSKVNGTLKADTTSYTFAPGKAYDVKFSTTGTTAVPVVTVNGKVVSIAPRGNGVYRVTAQNPGTAYVVAKVGDTHVSVKFVVANGAASAGVKGNNVSNLK